MIPSMIMSVVLCAVGAMGNTVCAVMIDGLRCEYLKNPLSIDTDRPRLSWIIASDQRAQRQTAFRVLVASSPERLAADQGDLWDSGKVKSEQSVFARYAGTPLASGARCYWKVRIWDRDDVASGWSTPAQFTVGLLSAGDWKGRWIGMASAGDHEEPWFRKTFTLEQKPHAALAYVGSIGYHELYVNGRKVGDRVLNPSVSYLAKRALYVTYDITDYLKPGANVAAVWLAPGWSLFKGVNPVMDFQLSKRPLLMAQLDIRTRGKTSMVVVSDETWKCRLSSEKHLGEWTYTNYGGDRIDGRGDLSGWNDVGCSDSAWERATAYDLKRILSPDLVEPNRKCETIRPVSVTKMGPRKYRVDMGRFYTGWVEAKLKGAPGKTIAISLSYDRTVECQYNQRDEYIVGAGGQGTFCNHFSYHGCRYVTIEGLDSPPALADIVGYRIGNDFRRAGSFDCSNKLFKRTYDADVNTLLNLTTGGVMVDCPHRERLGYGDTCQTSLETMMGTVDAGAFYTKWARDWCDIQQDNGYVAHTAPMTDGGGGPCWSGSIMMIPWGVFQSCGDRRILESSYPHVKRWLAFLQAKCDTNGLLLPFVPPGGTTYPQWCFLGDWVTPHGSEMSDSIEALFFNNCYYLLALRTASSIARELGHDDDTKTYQTRAEGLKRALNSRFFNATTNSYLDGRQGRYAMALVSGAVPEDRIAAVMANLRSDVLVTRKGHLDVGDPVIQFMTKYLTERDANDVVFAYMNQTTFPSYGFFLGRGLDTWPETWDNRGPDSSIIHGCFTGISGWFLRGIAGIRPDPAAPGFKRMIIKPAVVGDLTWAEGCFNSLYGRIVSKWKRNGNTLTIEITIPANTTATIYLPAADSTSVLENGTPAESAVGVKFLHMEDACAVFQVQSGHYSFVSIMTKPSIEEQR